MPDKSLFRLGLVLFFIATAIFFSAGHWLNSRIFTPLDIPVSLEARQIQSPTFHINLRESYFVSLDLDFSVDDYYTDGRCNYNNLHGSRWRVYRLNPQPGRPPTLWAKSDESDVPYPSYPGEFFASAGLYKLEWDLPDTAACLNPRHPRLSVYTDSSDYRSAVTFIQIGCIFCGGTAAALVVLVSLRVLKRIRGISTAPRMFPDMVLRNVMPIAKHAPLPLTHDPPHWPLFCAAILWILVFAFMIWGPLPSHGLLVNWRTRDAVVWDKSPWPETLEVYVASPARFFINGQEVERNNLRAKLTEQLSRRAEWTVYFEADPDITYMNAIYAIDTIQACGANLVWVTPKMREQWKQALNSRTDAASRTTHRNPR